MFLYSKKYNCITAYDLSEILRLSAASAGVSQGIPRYFRRFEEISTPIGHRDETKISVGILSGVITETVLKKVSEITEKLKKL